MRHGNTGLFLCPELGGLSSRAIRFMNGAEAAGKDAAVAIILWTSSFPKAVCDFGVFGDLLKKEQQTLMHGANIDDAVTQNLIIGSFSA